MKIEYGRKAVKYINGAEYRLRVGDLRVLFTLEEDLVTINDIQPRGQIYKRL